MPTVTHSTNLLFEKLYTVYSSKYKEIVMNTLNTPDLVIVTAEQENSDLMAELLEGEKLNIRPIHLARELEGLLRSLDSHFKDIKALLLSSDTFDDSKVNLISAIKAIRKTRPDLLILISMTLTDDDTLSKKKVVEAGATSAFYDSEIVTPRFTEWILSNLSGQVSHDDPEDIAVDPASETLVEEAPDEDESTEDNQVVIEESGQPEKVKEIEEDKPVDSTEAPAESTDESSPANLGEDTLTKATENIVTQTEQILSQYNNDSIHKADILVVVLESYLFLIEGLLKASQKPPEAPPSQTTSDVTDTQEKDHALIAEPEEHLHLYPINLVQISKTESRVEFDGRSFILSTRSAAILKIIIQGNGECVSAVVISRNFAIQPSTAYIQVMTLKNELKVSAPFLVGRIITKRGNGYYYDPK
jgi:hypothetical protein